MKYIEVNAVFGEGSNARVIPTIIFIGHIIAVSNFMGKGQIFLSTSDLPLRSVDDREEIMKKIKSAKDMNE